MVMVSPRRATEEPQLADPHAQCDSERDMKLSGPMGIPAFRASQADELRLVHLDEVGEASKSSEYSYSQLGTRE